MMTKVRKSILFFLLCFSINIFTVEQDDENDLIKVLGRLRMINAKLNCFTGYPQAIFFIKQRAMAIDEIRRLERHFSAERFEEIIKKFEIKNGHIRSAL